MKCPHCGVEVLARTAGRLCPTCGKAIPPADSTIPMDSPLNPSLMVQPPQESSTATETWLGLVAWLCLPGAVVVAAIAFLAHNQLLPLLITAAGILLNGLVLMAMRHMLRYLRLTVNSLTAFRARPLGSEIEE